MFLSSSSCTNSFFFLSYSVLFSFSFLRAYLCMLNMSNIFFRSSSYNSEFFFVAIILSGMFKPCRTYPSFSSIFPGSWSGFARYCCRENTFCFFHNSLRSTCSFSFITSSGTSSSFKAFLRLICYLSSFFMRIYSLFISLMRTFSLWVSWVLLIIYFSSSYFLLISYFLSNTKEESTLSVSFLSW